MTLPLRLHFPRSPFGPVRFDMDVVSRAANGLPGRKICGATNFANPYDHPFGTVPAADRRALFVDMLRNPDSRRGRWIRAHVRELAGHNLFCTCPDGEPCSGDVLIVLANSTVPVERALA